MQMTARSFGIQLLLLEIHPDDFRDAFIAIDKHGADALVVNADPDPYLKHAGLPTGPRISLAHNLSHAGAGLRLEG
jgi:hypothetical protein